MQHTVARRILEALEGRQEELWRRIEREVDSTLRGWKPASAVWSITEIVQHIGLSEHAMLGTARRAPQVRNPFRVVKYWTVRAVLKSSLRFRAPVTQILPAPDVTWEQAMETTRSGMQRWQTYLASQSDYIVFVHPVTGPMTVRQTATFLGDHFNHHVPQIERLMRSLPAARLIIWS